VSTPISVNNKVMHLAGVKSMFVCPTVTFAGNALARSEKLRLIFDGDAGMPWLNVGRTEVDGVNIAGGWRDRLRKAVVAFGSE